MSETYSAQRLRIRVRERLLQWLNVDYFFFSHGDSTEAKNRKGASVWDYAIDNSDNSQLTTLVKACSEKEGIADEDQLTFEGT